MSEGFSTPETGRPAGTNGLTTDELLRGVCLTAAGSLPVDGIGMMTIVDNPTRFSSVSHPDLQGPGVVSGTVPGPCRPGRPGGHSSVQRPVKSASSPQQRCR